MLAYKKHGFFEGYIFERRKKAHFFKVGNSRLNQKTRRLTPLGITSNNHLHQAKNQTYHLILL